jgi:hypothetical protein
MGEIGHDLAPMHMAVPASEVRWEAGTQSGGGDLEGTR